MRNKSIFVLAIGISTLAASLSNGASFQSLGDLPGGVFQSVAMGVSADGSIVVGASSSEKIIVPRVVYAQDVTGDVTTPCINGPYPVDIPVGTRLSIRVKSSSISQGTMNFGLYGVK